MVRIKPITKDKSQTMTCKNTISFLVTLALLFSSFRLSMAQTPLFHSLDTSDGLSSSTVNTLLVDSRGILWVGTACGLNRYDGYEVKTFFKYDDSHNVNSVADIQEDCNGDVWIEAESYYVRYVRERGTFDTDAVAYLKSLGMEMDGAYSICTDKDRNLWVVTAKKVYHYDFGQSELSSWDVDLRSAAPGRLCVKAYRDGVCFCHDNTVTCFSPRYGGDTRVLSLPEEMVKEFGYLKLYVDDDGNLWVYSLVSEKICVYQHDTDNKPEMVTLPPNGKSKSNAIRAILDDGKAKIWIATDHSGVFLRDKHSGRFTQFKHEAGDPMSLSSDNVTSLLCDKNGTMWLGHLKTGVSYCNEQYNFFMNKGRSCGDISTMMYDDHGRLWLGTDGDGVFVEHGNGEVEKTSVPNITVSSLLQDRHGTVWVGSYNEGLFRMNGTKSHKVYTSSDGSLPHNSVWQMVLDREGVIWYSSAFGPLSLFDTETCKGRVFDAGDGGTIYGLCLEYDGEDKVYVGTSYGLWICDLVSGKGQLLKTNRSGKQPFYRSFVGSMCLDKKNGFLWLGHSTGMTGWDLHSDSLYYIDKSTGLYDENVKSITVDNMGDVWLSTGIGLSCVRMSYGERGGVSFRIRNFTMEDGLQTNYFNKFATTRGADGEILMGGDRGYVVVTPKRAFTDNVSTMPVFTDIFVGDSVRSLVNGCLKLRYNDYQISVSYFTGNLVNARQVTYAYRIKGFIDDWVVTNDNKISFLSLGPGEYVLELKARGEGSDWGETATLRIKVSPPFYASKWALALYVCVLLAMTLYAGFVLRRRQRRKIEKHREEMEREQAVNLSEMKLRFFTNVSHDLRTPLTLIISPLQSMLNENLPDRVKTRLRVMHKNADLLMHQVNTLLDFRKLDVGAEKLNLQSSDIVQYVRNACHSFTDYADERMIRLSFHTDVETLVMDFDAEKIDKIMYNLLSNAFKFTPDKGEVGVDLRQNGDTLVIDVADDGIGIDDEEKEAVFQRFYQVKASDEKTGSGIGLHVVSEYVKMHGGTVCVKDNDPRGSVFRVTLPIKSVSSDKYRTETPRTADTYSLSGMEDLDNVSVRADDEPYTVLVVDDNHDMCEFVADSLRDEYNVLTASDGEEALTVLGENNVNLVVSDVMMPNIDGLELCRRIKTTVQWSHIPVILLTAKTADVAVIDGLQQGADDYITKPFNVEHLRLRVRKFVEWADKRHNMFSSKMDLRPSDIAITSLDEKFVNNVMRIVEEHMSDENFSVESLGREVGMSRTNLYKKLVNITGRGPHEFIRVMRLKRACQLLDKSQMQIAEIAYQVGYSSPKRFSENFKNEYGMTPSEYVKSKR